MIKKLLILIFTSPGVGAAIIIGVVITIGLVVGGYDKDYSVSDLKENFEKNKHEIYELKKYYNEIVPKNRFVEIEFDDDHTLARLGIESLDIATGGQMFLEWNLKTNTKRIDSIIKPIGWTRATLKILKEKLDKANCIGIASGEPTKIGFQRSGMGMYSFNVFDEPIPDSRRMRYNDSCRFILVNSRLVLEYGGGAIGTQCFYKLD